jgi:uracil-DNA glycosylase family 4
VGSTDRRAPPRDCARCPRLAAYRAANRAAEPTWHNAPVPSFGPADARLLVVGLAPGRGGANRTGRPFTGDYAGDVLYAALRDYGFATGTYRAEPDDGLVLHDCRVTNAVRCVPPENKPTASEIQACRPFLEDELRAGTPPELVLCLGRVAFDASLRALGATPSRHRFAHGATTAVVDGPRLIASYHTSRYNLNTGRLTRAMFDTVLAEVRRLLPGR